MSELEPFAARLLRWFDQHGRHDLPWQHPRTPYRVWLSEVMLQQTQVSTVCAYFTRFVSQFPDVAALAAAPLDAVLAQWSGLGYYSRARNLHAAAQHIVRVHAGHFPADMDALQALPGVGRSTAAAILAMAFGQRAAILDGNVKRVLARHTAQSQWPGLAPVQQALWRHAETLLPQVRLADYTQALMDLGATVCTPRRPQCSLCPVRSDCRAEASAQVAGIPAPRPRRDSPTRARHWLLLRNAAGELLLERRPANGIWGGLYALPEAEAPEQLCESAGCNGSAFGALREHTRIKHVFTHFRLQATVWLAETAGSAVHTGEGGRWHWRTPAAALKLGLPTPVRRLLASLDPG